MKPSVVIKAALASRPADTHANAGQYALSPPVGGSMTYWASEVRRPNSTYFDTVYTLGGAALVEAREQAGEEAFDAALADYLTANAHSIATPDDVREAFSDLPEVLGVLR